MKFGRKSNKRSDIPSFREFLYQEKILRESGIIDDQESDIQSNASNISKDKYKYKTATTTTKGYYKDNQIKAINRENYKLIKENGLLKEEIENYKKNLENKDDLHNNKDEKIKKLEKEIMRLKINESAKKEKKEEEDIPNGIEKENSEEKNKLNKIINDQKIKIK